MKIRSFLLLSVSLLLLSFADKYEINSCFISFKNATGLTAKEPERLPENAEKVRKLKTENGEVETTRVDGYRVLYNNDKNVPFVNLKVELSERNSYETDKKMLIENLRYLNSHSAGMEWVELNVNGYKIWGSSRETIENGMFLGTFVMFPGNGVTVYFYFKNLKPEYRNFESVDQYKKLRDQFINEYTKYLSTCK